MTGKKKKLTIFSFFICNLLLCSLSLYGSAAAGCRTDTPIATALVNFFWGKATVNGEDLQVGDEIRAYVYDVETNNGCVGLFEVTVFDPNSFYGAMSIYGDDVTTTEKDGALDGDIIHYFICRNGIEYESDQTGVWSADKNRDHVMLGLTVYNCIFYYRDHDQDTYGADDDFRCLIAQAGEYILLSGGDCNDNDPSILPGIQDICDGLDNDCDKKIDLEIADQNNLDLALDDLKEGKNKVLIETFCTSYTSYEFLFNFKELLNIASLNLNRLDNDEGSFMPTYFFFGKISGKEFELSTNPSSPKILMLFP